jgi:Zn-dependent protease
MLLFSLISSPLQFIYFIIAIVMSLTIHEFSHAYAAEKLGDSTAKMMGRLSLNPLAHLDIWGTVFLLLAGFGWGKPVIVNPRNFKNPALDNLTTSLAGPMSNLLLAIVFGLILRFAPLPQSLQTLFYIITFYNLVFMIFNLIPIPPLDGSKILGLFLPEEVMINFQQYGMIILLVLVIFSSSIPVIPYLLTHVVNFFFTLITGFSVAV